MRSRDILGRFRLRLRVKLFCDSDFGSGSGQNVPAPAAPAPMLKSSYEPELAIRFFFLKMLKVKTRPLIDLTLSLNVSLKECL